jgi:hypothetical protein
MMLLVFVVRSKCNFNSGMLSVGGATVGDRRESIQGIVVKG